MPADLAARIVVAAARAICHTDCAENFLDAGGLPACLCFTDCLEHDAHMPEARAAIAAAVREAGLDAAQIRSAATVVAERSALRRRREAENWGHNDRTTTAALERTAALLRALAEIADD